MFEYLYTREFLTPENHWDICYCNPNFEPPCEETCLATEIFSAIGKNAIVRCAGTSCKILFVDELTGQEESDLDDTVAAHKAAAHEQI